MARIGTDLSKVRHQQGMSLEEVHTSSRIPITILETIEDGSIFSDLAINNTMIRSNVRSFARVLKLDDQKIIEALDALEKGKDIGFLPQEEKEDEPVTESSSAPSNQKSSRRKGRSFNRKKNTPPPAQKSTEAPNTDFDESNESESTYEENSSQDENKPKSVST